MQRDKILEWLGCNLDKERYFHSLGTADTAKKLAKIFNLDIDKAELAGLVHDCAKCLSNKELLDIISKNMTIDECEFKNYKTLHAPAGSIIARRVFGIEDEEILSSIRWHTVGKLGMTDFEKIIFVADKIEPNTRPKEYIDYIEPYLYKDDGLNRALLQCYKATIKSLIDRGLYICQSSLDIYNELIECYKND